MRIFRPSGVGPWLEQVLSSIERGLKDVWTVPLRLWRSPTASLPTATTDNEGGLVYDETTSRITYSDGAAWTSLMPYNAGAALSKADDTNVTLTLGGTPLTALLQATSITVGWSGTLAVARGGTGTTTSTGTGSVVLSVSPTLTGTLIANAADFGSTVNVSQSLTTLSAPASGNPLALKSGAADLVYISLFARNASPSTRSGWFGYGASATTLWTFNNEIGNIEFWPNNALRLTLSATGANVAGTYSVNGTQVAQGRITGWAAASGTATRTTFDTATVTTAQLAERVKALIDDLRTHGLIGT